MQYIADALVEFEFTGRPRARATSDDSAASPHGAFPARGDDAWIAISVTTEQEWCALLAQPFGLGLIDVLAAIGGLGVSHG